MNFERDYELVFRAGSNDVVVNPPLRIAFSADKSESGGLNKLQVKIYNLTEKNRLALVRDAESKEAFVPVTLTVGYKGQRGLIFRGNIYTGENSRDGVDLITTLECLDGGTDYLHSFTARTIKGGERVIATALQDMPNTATGKITKRPMLTRPKVLVGNSAQLIEDTIGPDETWYIEDEQLFILKDNEVISQFIPVVNAETGLISTPSRKQKKVTFQTMMNPAIKIRRRIQLQSVTAPHLDGIYQVRDINYSGDNFGDDWSMTCTCYLTGADVVVL
jgi:hypothetical protein